MRNAFAFFARHHAKARLRIERIKERAEKQVAHERLGLAAINSRLSHEIKVARVDARMAASTFADQLGICQSYLSNLEAGRATWTAELLLAAQPLLKIDRRRLSLAGN